MASDDQHQEREIVSGANNNDLISDMNMVFMQQSPSVFAEGYMEEHQEQGLGPWDLDVKSAKGTSLPVLVAPFAAVSEFQQAATALHNLCTACKKIDWVPFFMELRTSRVTIARHHQTLQDLQIAAAQSCPLCRLVYRLLDPVVNKIEEDLKASQSSAAKDSSRESGLYFRPQQEIRSSNGIDAFFSIQYGTESTSKSIIVTPLTENVLRCGYRRPLSGGFDFGLWRSWLHECSKSHDKCCLLDQEVPLPTRIIDIGDSQGMPKLVETRDWGSNKSRGLYVALSHCWGSQALLTTTTKNLEAHKAEIPTGSLSATFSDAIEVVRGLGLRYLWIDSLCIIQDSKEDWARECQLMRSVYSRATLTISARGASDGSGGLRIRGPPEPLEPTVVNILAGEQQPQIVAQVEFAPLPFTVRNWRCYNPRIHTEYPLDSRAWAQQERLLSPRVLNFTHDQIFIQCASCIRSEAWKYPLPFSTPGHEDFNLLAPRDHPYGPGWPPPKGRPFRAPERAIVIIYPPQGIPRYGDQVGEMVEAWYDLIEKYTDCSITEGQDRMPAISGIAQRFQEVFQSEYLAGIWDFDAAYGLSWLSAGSTNSVIPATRLVPSWSWIACDGPVLYSYIKPTQQIDLENASPDDITQWRLEDLGYWFTCLDIRSHSIKPSVGFDTFGQIERAALTVAGKIQRASLVLGFEKKLPGWGERLLCRADIRRLSPEGPREPFGNVNLDTDEYLQKPPGQIHCEEVYCLLLQFIPNYRCHALVLKHDNALDRFRRIGIVGAQYDDQCRFKPSSDSGTPDERLRELVEHHRSEGSEVQGLFCSENLLGWLLEGEYKEIELV